MKSILMVLSLLLSAQVYANDALTLFSKRGQDTKNALEASELYESMATKTRNNLNKAEFLTRQSQALYYFASNQSDKKMREKYHQIAFVAADEAIKELSKEKTIFGDTPIQPNLKSNLSEAHYFSAINMGKWAEARGVFASLNEWPDMKKHLEAVKKLDHSVEDFGYYRTMGRALMKLPFTHGGSKKKSEKNLKKGYELTYNEDFFTSTNTTTTLYYLDILAQRGDDTETFCEVYYGMSDVQAFTEEELLELNSKKVPESKNDIKSFEDGSVFENNVRDFADSNC